MFLSRDDSFLTGVATMIKNEYSSKLKFRFTELKDWMSLITIIDEKTVCKSKIAKKNDEREGEELKTIYNP